MLRSIGKTASTVLKVNKAQIASFTLCRARYLSSVGSSEEEHPCPGMSKSEKPSFAFESCNVFDRVS